MCNTIKSCPHCGGDAYLFKRYIKPFGQYATFIKCEGCGCQSAVFLSDDDPEAGGWSNEASKAAAECWNKRTEEQEDNEQ